MVPADQVVYALTNLVPLIPLSRSLTATEFGEVALAQSLVVGTAVLGRAYFATPLLAVPHTVGVRSPTAAILTRRSMLAAATGAVALLALSAISALPLPGPAKMALLCFGLLAALPVEIRRMSFIRAGLPALALVSDLAWLVAEVAVFIVGPLIGISLGTAALASWSVGAIVAAATASALAARIPHTASAPELSNTAETDTQQTMLQRLPELGRGFLTEAIFLVARVQGYFFTLALISGSAALGGVRFAFALVAPVNTALAGWRTYATGQFREQEHHTLTPLIAGPPLVVAAGLVLVVAVVPDSWVDAVSGNADAGPYLFYVATAIALSAVDIVVQAFLASREQTNLLWMVRIFEVGAWLISLIVIQPTAAANIGQLLLLAAALSTAVWIATYWIATYRLLQQRDQ